MISYVYANRRPRKCATKSTREPTRARRGVFHSTDLMFSYHSGALSGSAAYRATSSTGRLMTTVFTTSTVTAPISHHTFIARRRPVEWFCSVNARPQAMYSRSRSSVPIASGAT